MKLKNVLLTGLSFVLVAAVAIGGTLAYLTSEDSDVNVMTLGNVSIEQHEYEREVDANGNYVTDANYGYKLKDFTQAKPLFPATEIDSNGAPYNYGAGNYDSTRVKMAQVGSHGSMDVFVNKNAQDKFVTVENTGLSDAYVRTIFAFEIGSFTVSEFNNVIKTSSFMTQQGVWNVNGIGIATIDGNNYYVYEYIYNGGKSLGGVHENGVLPAGDTTYPSLAQVYMTGYATNEDCENIDGNKNGTYDILVFSQAVQTEGFANSETALDTAFGDITTTNHPWTDGVETPTIVSTAEELTAAIAEGGEIILSKDITDFNANNTISVAAEKNVTLNLNGHKISATANKTGSQELFLVKGNMTVKNGTLELTAENNQAWNAMATIFDVTAGGVLNMEGVIAKVDGTDMNFIVHLNNWGEATLNVNNCDFTASYVAVRVFNSGYDMNNVTIKNTDFHTGRVFWVHNYTAEGQDDSTLNLDIYGNNNTTDNQKPVRFGFSNSVYYDINGNALQ